MRIKVNNFNLKDTIESGQCFRISKEKDGSYTTILFDRVLNVKQEDNILICNSNNLENLEKVVRYYFDLDRDYSKINKELCVDEIMSDCISKCNGYKIMNQDSFEMCISYIISQNNNVKRISNSINKLCEDKGSKVIFNEKEYYLFPKYSDIKNITEEELRNYGVGFRDKYIKNFINQYEYMKDLNSLSTSDALEELMKVKGIGLKVASCILLFGYGRFDTFPIDTWVMKFISNKYYIKNDQKSIKEFVTHKFNKYVGLAIQYMFHSERNIK